MALFSRSKETENKADDAAVAKRPAPKSTAKATDRDLSGVLVKPRVTEKAVGQSGNNVYTFIVRADATKHDVRDAVQQVFSVTPVKVNIVNKQSRQYLSRSKGRVVTEKGMKKAYVYLKSGDSISLV